jgi:endonuclease YncB( thermonuclease family)
MRYFLWILFCLVATPGLAAQAVVTDGDTLVLDGKTYRLDGVDAPQTDQVCLDAAGSPWTCGVEVRDQLKQFIGSRAVRCEEKGSDPVYRNRRIGICWVDGETKSLNQWLVQQGWALNYEPYAKGRFLTDQKTARDNQQGLWKGCFVAPQILRRWTKSTAKLLGAHCPSDEWSALGILFPDDPAMPPGCTIKGKLAARAHVTGHRGVYHLEECASYRRTKKPDRWFCSEAEAQAEGFRKAFTCLSSKR